MEKDSLKNIVAQNLRVEPSSSFTSKVMKNITLQANEALLKSTFKANLIYNAPDDFASKVFQKITQKEQVTAYQPVIGKNVWYILGVLFILILVLGLKSSPAPHDSKYLTTTLNIFNSKLDLFSHFLVSNSFIMLLIISISGLIIIDSFLKLENIFFKKAS